MVVLTHKNNRTTPDLWHNFYSNELDGLVHYLHVEVQTKTLSSNNTGSIIRLIEDWPNNIFLPDYILYRFHFIRQYFQLISRLHNESIRYTFSQHLLSGIKQRSWMCTSMRIDCDMPRKHIWTLPWYELILSIINQLNTHHHSVGGYFHYSISLKCSVKTSYFAFWPEKKMST